MRLRHAKLRPSWPHALLLAGACLVAAGCTEIDGGTVVLDCPCDAEDALDVVPRGDLPEPDSEGADAGPDDVGAGDALDVLDSGSDTGPDLPPAVTCTAEPFAQGLTGGPMASVARDPRVGGGAPGQPGAWYATSGATLFASVDGGATWNVRGRHTATLGRLAFPASEPKVLLASGPAGVARSQDSGVTWEPWALDGLDVTALWAHPADPSRLFAGTRGSGILRSTSGAGGGSSAWTPVGWGVPYGVIYDFAGPTDDPAVVFAGLTRLAEAGGPTDDGAVLRSDDGGATWDLVLDGVGWGHRLAVCPTDGQRVVAAVRDGVARSLDGGDTWALDGTLAGEDVTHVALSGPGCERVYVGVFEQGVYRSDDFGATFVGPFTEGLALQPDKPHPDGVAADPGTPDRLLLATRAGIYVSNDAGESFAGTEVSGGVAINALESSPDAPGRLWMATWGSGVWTRTGVAEGTAWERVDVAALPRDFAFGVSVDPVDGDRVFVGANPDLWRSADGGESFELTPQGGNVFQVAFHPTEADVLVAVSQTQGVRRSTDGGATWADANGDGDGDGALTPWVTPNGEFVDVRAVVRDAADPDRLIVGTRGRGVFQSVDEGASWAPLSEGTLGAATVWQLVQDPTDPAVLWARVEADGLWRSADGGATFQPASGALPSPNVLDARLTVATDGPRLFATVDDEGLWTTLDGALWERVPSLACLASEGLGRLGAITDAASGTAWVVTSTLLDGVVAVPVSE